MNLFKNFLLLASLCSFGLVACATDDQDCTGSECSAEAQENPSMVTLSFAVEGTGEVFIEEPIEASCTGAMGYCSFTLPLDSQVVVHSNGEFSDDLGWQDGCEGFGRCVLTLNQDKWVVANFTGEQADPIIIIEDPPPAPEVERTQMPVSSAPVSVTE